jgi:hypothetical protein
VGDAQSIARNISALKARQKAAAKGKGSKVVKGTESESAASSGYVPVHSSVATN